MSQNDFARLAAEPRLQKQVQEHPYPLLFATIVTVHRVGTFSKKLIWT